MPNLDGTGPLGQGPMTGRRRGRCVESKTPPDKKNRDQNIESRDVIYGYRRGGRRTDGGRPSNRFGGGFSQRFDKGHGRGYGRGFGNI